MPGFGMECLLDNSLVCLGASNHVVGFDGEDFLKDVGGAECLERPYLHLSETLATELRLTSKRLLGDERVGTDGTRMHLVLHHVAEFQHVDHADGGRLIKAVAGASVVKISLAITRNSGLVGPFVEVVERRAVKDRGGEFLAELTSGPSGTVSKICPRFIREGAPSGLSTMSTGVPSSKERHVFLTHHTRHDTLVTVTSRHLVAHAYLTLLGYVDLGHLHDSGRKLIADGYVELLAAQLAVDLLGLAHIVGDQLTDHAVHALVAGPSGNVHSLIIYGTEVPHFSKPLPSGTI